MNRLHIKSVAICLVLAGSSSILAQNSNPAQKSSTKVFGLPVSKSDNANELKTSVPTADRSEATATKSTSEAEIGSRLRAVSGIYVSIEGTRQGKIKGTTPRGADSAFECLTYKLEPQGSQNSAGRGKPSIYHHQRVRRRNQPAS